MDRSIRCVFGSQNFLRRALSSNGYVMKLIHKRPIELVESGPNVYLGCVVRTPGAHRRNR
jgi:hypothetical protein